MPMPQRSGFGSLLLACCTFFGRMRVAMDEDVSRLAEGNFARPQAMAGVDVSKWRAKPFKSYDTGKSFEFGQHENASASR